MLKRPMETGHVDVAADAMRRAAPQIAMKIFRHCLPAAAPAFFRLSTADRSAARDLNPQRDNRQPGYPDVGRIGRASRVTNLADGLPIATAPR